MMVVSSAKKKILIKIKINKRSQKGTISKQWKEHDKLSSTTRSKIAVVSKKENLSSLKITNLDFCGIPLRLMVAALSQFLN